ncbi:hypothetical protein [Nesterenkonia sp. HG001]|uniref:hypothetical protein n=1 Tax=Nesterenkonia sp. HG001 TaxID=2983207 RepID=UPI002AC50529|nr:hypothetical protein [Nesterenkonia sp. HG001]MDZ5076729.1 hypothetical protein [Nesterenkonia sp. HG001]
MPAGVWTGVLAAAVWPLVEYRYTVGRDLDSDWADPEIPRTVSVGQVVSAAVAPHGVALPEDDPRLLAVLRRDMVMVESSLWWMLAVHADDGRLGVVTPRGVVESAGEQLGLILSPEPGRYRGYFPVPGVRYQGVSL